MRLILFLIPTLLTAQTLITTQPYNGIQPGPYYAQPSIGLEIISWIPITLTNGCTISTSALPTLVCPPAPQTITYTTSGTITLTRATIQPSAGSWVASTTFGPTAQLTDPNGNVQQVYNTSATPPSGVAGTSGIAQPAWNTALWGITVDGTLTWMNTGISTQVWCVPNGTVGPNATLPNNILPTQLTEWVQTATFVTSGGTTSMQSISQVYPLTGYLSRSYVAGTGAAQWTQNASVCAGAPSLTFIQALPLGTTRICQQGATGCGVQVLVAF